MRFSPASIRSSRCTFGRLWKREFSANWPPYRNPSSGMAHCFPDVRFTWTRLASLIRGWFRHALTQDLGLEKANSRNSRNRCLLRFLEGMVVKLFELLNRLLMGSMKTDKSSRMKVIGIAQQKVARLCHPGAAFVIIWPFINRSAFDPNAAVYWLARMIEGARMSVIARRLSVLASWGHWQC